MRYGPPLAVISAAVTAPRPTAAWRAAAADVPGGELVRVDGETPRYTVDAVRAELEMRVLETGRWAAAVVGGLDRTVTVVAPRSPGTELDAYRVLVRLAGGDAPGSRPAAAVRERFTPRHRTRLAVDPRRFADRLEELVAHASPGRLREFPGERIPDPALLHGPDEDGGSALLHRPWALPDPPGVRVLEHTDDPAGHYPLALRPDPDGTWWIEHAAGVVDPADVACLRERLESGTAPASPPTRPRPLHDVIAARLTADADRTAVHDGATVLTYADLDRRSAAVAAALRAAGCGRGDAVGLHLPRSADAVVAIVAILRVGATYVPLDPDFPEARLRDVADRTALRAVVRAGTPFAWSDAPGVDVRGCRDVDPASVPWEPVGDLDGLYVLFTSGSTGRPKGVLHTVGAISRLVAYHLSIRSGPGAVLQFATLNFDVASQEILTGLAAGSRIVVTPPAARLDPSALVAVLRDDAVTEFFCPQVLLQEVCRAALREGVRLPALRHVYQSGEPLVMNTWLERFLTANPAVTLHNHYGPTETHVITAWPLPRRGRRPGPVDLGPLATGSGGHVLGADLRPVTGGEVGELYATEPQVARGYVADPRLTAARFVPDPAGGGGRMYRTGDLVVDDGHGALAFVGRSDFQTKIRGHRVEPEEVTARLLEVPGVDNAATFVTRSEAGENRLESVVAGGSAPAGLRERALDHLRAHLPDYLVPSSLAVVDAIARTATGKIDRAALVADDAPRESTPDAPETPADPVRRAWTDLLGGPAGPDDDFFALGGSSITAMHLARRLHDETGVRIGVADVVAHPRLDDLGALLAERAAEDGGRDGDRAVLRDDPEQAHAPFGLLDQQQAYLIGRDPEFDGGDVACHLYLEYAGQTIDVARLERALQQVVAHHPMLRTVFDTATFTQRVLSDVPPVRIEVVDGGREALARIRDRISHEQRAFDEFPLFTAVVVRGDGRVWLCLSLDALLVDARSVRQIVRDWERAYAGTLEPDPSRPTFRDYVDTVTRWRAGDGAARYRRAREYWQRRVPELPAPPRLPTTDGNGPPRFVNRRHVVDARRWSAVKAHAGGYGLTPSGVLLAAYAAALAQWATHGRFLLNVPRFGREDVHPRVDEIVGEFASFDLLDVDTTGNPSFAGLAARVQRRLTEDLDHGELSGMEVLRELLRHHGALGAAAAPVVFTSELGVGDGIGTLFDGRLRQVYALSQTPQVWMDLLVGEEDGALVVRWDVVEDRFPDAVVDGIFWLLVTQVHALADGAAWVEPPLRAVSGDRAADRGRAAPAGAPGRVLDRIAVHDPARVAVLDGRDGGVRSRAELLGAAGAVAAGIRAVVADEDLRPVAVAVPPGQDGAAAVLGVLATGRPYLPVDVEDPPARIATLLRRTPVAAVVTDLAEPSWTCPVVPVHGPAAVPLAADATPDTAAVLFTSGSTGTPKAVPVPMRGLEVCVAETIRMTGLSTSDRSLALARPHHDLSFFDLLVVPAAGGGVVFPGAQRDPARWAELVSRHRVTAVCAVPAAVEMLLDGAAATGACLTSLRTVLTGGDWVPPELVARLRRAAPAVRVWSIGGPTETTAWNIAHRISDDGVPPGWTTVPYGRPLPGTCYRVVDARLDDRPERAVGELIVSGPGVMAGYLGENSGPSPLVTDPATGEVFYRTGDLGAFRDGLVEFHGRADRQLEIRGRRIEPGEVESVLREHDAVSAAAVVPIVHDGRAHGLAAFVTATAPVDALIRWLAERLPRHLVPNRIDVVGELPRNRAGKVDRTLLTDRAATRAPDVTEPDTDPLARLVRDIWAEELDLADVGPEDSFFELGGDSMTGFKLIVALREVFGDEVPVSIRTLLESRTVAEFVATLRDHERSADFARVASLYATT
ncbi:AMP-binding protein [Pseudonocardia endophytica]|uniref:Phenyloxazoline synthase MbtB n=1 Tax=Pseudonocardia endophytica TaxID=401976 RepID=A0A4R1I3L7_PSEEN|nr:AMP-binding protein [Pseudonocardia endophytica]TCK24592.1 amino acid adenylation domain-containing protein [Pseudonocardia endophytica]